MFENKLDAVAIFIIVIKTTYDSKKRKDPSLIITSLTFLTCKV